jgi:hypothetical protein
MPTTARRQRPLATLGMVISSAWQASADSRSNIELHTGITMASANMTTRASSKPCMPPGVSSTTWVMPVGTRNMFFWSTAQGAMAGSEASRRFSQARADCCRSTSPSMTELPLRAHQAAMWAASVLLPLPPLRLTTAMTGMNAPKTDRLNSLIQDDSKVQSAQ